VFVPVARIAFVAFVTFVSQYCWAGGNFSRAAADR
jgi:hypothetical protein